MTPAARHAIDHVLRVEGGLVDHPEDPGGITNYGISLRAYPQLGVSGIRYLQRHQAVDIYHRDYWLPVAAVVTDDRLRVMVFDAAVNHGLARALRWYRDHPSLPSYTAYRLRFYTRLQTFTAFGRGWTNRMASVMEAIAQMPNPLLDVATLHLIWPGGSEVVYPLDDARPARVVGRKLYANHTADV